MQKYSTQVPVSLDVDASVLEDGRVVAPAGLGQVDGLVAREPLGQEGGPDPEGAGAGDALGGHVAAVGDNVVAWNERGFFGAFFLKFCGLEFFFKEVVNMERFST